MLDRIANREDLIRLFLQKQSDLVRSVCLGRFWQVTMFEILEDHSLSETKVFSIQF